MMLKPDPKKHNSDPEYIRSLIARTGKSQRKVAKAIGKDVRTLQRYTSPDGGYGCPYPIQFMLESLAAWVEAQK